MSQPRHLGMTPRKLITKQESREPRFELDLMMTLLMLINLIVGIVYIKFGDINYYENLIKFFIGRNLYSLK
jgi:hypothetical protein